eukprot:373429_1
MLFIHPKCGWLWIGLIRQECMEKEPRPALLRIKNSIVPSSESHHLFCKFMKSNNSKMQWQSALTLLQKSHESLSAENHRLKNELQSCNLRLTITKRKNDILTDLNRTYTSKYKELTSQNEKLKLHCSYRHNQHAMREHEQVHAMNRRHDHILHLQQVIHKLKSDNHNLYGIYHEYIKQQKQMKAKHDTEKQTQIKLQQQHSATQTELNRAYSQLIDAKTTINELYTVIAALQHKMDRHSPSSRSFPSSVSNWNSNITNKLICSDTNMLSLYTSYTNTTRRHLSESAFTIAESNRFLDEPSTVDRGLHHVKDSEQETKDDDLVTITYTDDSETTTHDAFFLANRGYKRGKRISRTLHGFVYEVESNKTGFKYLAKQMDKHLDSHGIAMQNGKRYTVQQNIMNEKCILESITKQNPPLFVVSFVDWFESERYFYLIMEHGENNLFDFVVQAHQYIENGALTIKQWRKFVKYIFWQMCVLFLWLHNIANISHLDVSPENILLQNAAFIEQDNGQLSISNDIVIKVCGFGFAQFHDIGQGPAFMSTKCCINSASNSKSPQVYAGKEEYDARKADVWSLGVVLFCMAVGNAPYRVPCAQDEYYNSFIQKGQIARLLYGWRRHHYVTQKLLALMECMLKHDEDKRYLMDDVVQHTWLSIYYNKNYESIKSDLLSTIFKDKSNEHL